MNNQEFSDYLNSFINYEKILHKVSPAQFKLERVRRLLQLFGNPQKDLKIIHVAGTKGKGSVSAMIASILKSAGLKAGLYTSPHIHHYRERIRVLGTEQGAFTDDLYADCISEKDLTEIIDDTRPLIEQVRADSALGRVSFYEVFTALAFYYFKRKGPDYVVVETGLGGRLDATNAADSMIAVLTPVSLEHTEILGDNVVDIAGEKAAIIKNKDQRVVVSPQDAQVAEVIRRRCDVFGIDPAFVSETSISVLKQDGNQTVADIKTSGSEYSQLSIALAGVHQAENAAVAIEVIECLQKQDRRIGREHIYRGLKDVFWPGRFEKIAGESLIIMDCAHNQASARELVRTFSDIYPGRSATIVFGVSEGKDIKGICRELSRIAGKIIFTRADHPRACSLSREELLTLFPRKRVDMTQRVDQALARARNEELVLVTGSVFLVSEARRLCTSIKV